MNKNHVVLELEEYNRLRDLAEKSEKMLEKLADECDEKIQAYKKQVADSFKVIKSYSGNAYLDINLRSELIAYIIHDRVKEVDSSLVVNPDIKDTTVWDIAYTPEVDETALARMDEEALEQVGEPM